MLANPTIEKRLLKSLFYQWHLSQRLSCLVNSESISSNRIIQWKWALCCFEKICLNGFLEEDSESHRFVLVWKLFTDYVHLTFWGPSCRLAFKRPFNTPESCFYRYLFLLLFPLDSAVVDFKVFYAVASRANVLQDFWLSVMIGKNFYLSTGQPPYRCDLSIHKSSSHGQQDNPKI
jgi:hypothetical protein